MDFAVSAWFSRSNDWLGFGWPVEKSLVHRRMDSGRMGFSNRQTLVKVPELVLLFWIAKVATTCFGEAFSDFVFFNDASWITRDRAIAAGAAPLLLAYGSQSAQKKNIPLVYWVPVTAV